MSQRTAQVESLIVTKISELLARDFESPPGTLITVMRASVAPDLKHATVFVSILPENRTGTAMEGLRKFTKTAQRFLNSQFAMKMIPQIRWELDVTTRKIAAIDEALK